MPSIQPAANTRFSLIERAATLAVVLLVAWFYFWTVDPERNKQAFTRECDGYYNFLAQGFMKGQLSLDLPADPSLAKMANPYDSVARAGRGLHDASYFRGRYYLYFGVTPVLVMFLPVRLLTGWFIAEDYASLVFAIAGFLVAAAVLRRIRNRWFGDAPGWVAVTGVVALGCATMVPALLRRPSVWEVPISCAFVLFMLTLWCVLRAMEEKRSVGWLAAASLMMGLCVGARPVYLFGSVVLLAPLVVIARQAGSAFWRRRDWWSFAAGAFGPIAVVGVGLAAYNYFRFGNPLEFGWTYQLAGDDNSAGKLFARGLVGFNLRLYLLSAAGISPYFPFVTVIKPPVAPVGQLGMENPYGLLPNLPWVGLGLVALVMAMVDRRRSGPAGELRWLVAAVWASCTATLLTLCSFRGAAGRYLVDFAPGFVLLGGVGALWVVALGPRWWRAIAASGVVILCGWSAAFGLLVSLQHNDLLRSEHPAIYDRLARTANRVAQGFVPLRDTDVGPVEMRVIFPRNATGQVEPLVATGREFRADYVFVHYLAENLIRFGFEHTSRFSGSGLPLRIDSGVPHVVRVSMGSLYPPRAHPYYDALGVEERRRRTRTLQVSLDGKIVLQRSMEFYDAAERTPAVGTSGGRPGFSRNFSGQLLSWKRVGDAPPASASAETGPLRMRIRLPAFAGKRSEPLLSTGRSGKGDLVYVTYEDAGHISFGHDHWGSGGSQSAPIAIDPAADQLIEVRCPPLLGAAAPPGWSLRLNGREVLANSEPFHPCEPHTISVMANEIQASTAEVFFSGEVLSVEQVHP